MPIDINTASWVLPRRCVDFFFDLSRGRLVYERVPCFSTRAVLAPSVGARALFQVPDVAPRAIPLIPSCNTLYVCADPGWFIWVGNRLISGVCSSPLSNEDLRSLCLHFLSRRSFSPYCLLASGSTQLRLCHGLVEWLSVVSFSGEDCANLVRAFTPVARVVDVLPSPGLLQRLPYTACAADDRFQAATWVAAASGAGAVPVMARPPTTTNIMAITASGVQHDALVPFVHS